MTKCLGFHSGHFYETFCRAETTVVHKSLAAKLAAGYLLDELKNDITPATPATFEPPSDYVVTKMPWLAFY